MDKGKEERAINLSTAGKDTDTDGPITNGDISKTTSLEQDNTSQGYGQGTSQVSSEFTPTQPSMTGSSKRKSRPSNLSASEPSSPVSSGVQSVLMLAAQHGLSPQQMQQLLQHHQGALPQQLNQLMQQQQSFVIQQQQQKAQEQLLLQLNEQLQLNVLQQSQLLQQQDKNKSSSGSKQIQQTMQQLAVQQQGLVQQIQQIQLQQRQFLLACLAQQPFGAPQGVLSPAEIQQLWKEAAEPNTEEQMKGLNGVTAGQLHPALLGLNGISHDAFPFAGHLIGQPQVNLSNEEEKTFSPLYRHKLCKWPGCDKYCEDTQTFTKHLNVEHTLDDRNTAQARVQMQVVSQLEIQLSREKELLHAMMQHLHLKPLRDREERENRAAEKAAMTSPKMTSPVGSPSKPSSLPVSSPKPNLPSVTMATMTPVTSGLPIVSGLPSAASLPVTSGLSPLVIPPHTQSMMTSVSQPPTPQSQSQPATPTGLGPIRRRVSDKCNLPISAEIQRNREFYKNTDVRPPFTYASLIRQAIIESENKQLTLNEVYQWFQSTFAYFRRNEATWKNAVRHNLSLHKCFMRVENVKGAVWTVDEIEFYKRRPQKLTGAMSNSPLTPEASIYGDTINASLRAALEHSSMLMSQQVTLSNGSLSDTGAEDLSMKSYNSSNDSFSKSDSPVRDEIFMKQEHLGLHEEVVGGASPCSNLSSHGNPSPRDLRRSPNPRHLNTTTQDSPVMKYMDKNGSEDIGRFTEMETEHEALDMQIKNHQSEALDMSHDPGMKLKDAVCTKDELENRRNVHNSDEMESPDLEETIRKEFSLRVEEDDERRAQIAETAREIELLRKASNGVSPHSPRELDHFAANQDPYSHLMHPGTATAVSHSITS